MATLPLAIRNSGGILNDKVVSRADKVIVLSERSKVAYEDAGVNPDRLHVIPNFVDSQGFSPQSPTGDHWVFIGRLSEEKGILQLLAHWPTDQMLVIYGDGPLREQVISMTRHNIIFKGQVERHDVPKALGSARGLIFPSLWAEGAIPLTYIESLAAGRPVVAIAGNAAADDIITHETGAVFYQWTELEERIGRVAADIDSYSQRAREHFEENFGADNWVERITSLYTRLMK